MEQPDSVRKLARCGRPRKTQQQSRRQAGFGASSTSTLEAPAESTVGGGTAPARASPPRVVDTSATAALAMSLAEAKVQAAVAAAAARNSVADFAVSGVAKVTADASKQGAPSSADPAAADDADAGAGNAVGSEGSKSTCS